MDVAPVFAQYRDALFRYVARYTGDADLAEDLVQETFVKLAERPPMNLHLVKGWLFVVATNLAKDVLKSSQRRRALGWLVAERAPMADPPPDPGTQAEAAELRQRVREALQGLSDKERTALLLREEGFAHREIATALGTTTGSVGTLVARALAKLAPRLDGL